MVEWLKQTANMIDYAHDWIWNTMQSLGFQFTDKELHFIVMAVVGMAIFAIVYLIFKFLSKYSIAAISFIYTLTIVIIMVVAIEVVQKATGSGSMETVDVAYGIGGFLSAFATACSIRGAILLAKELISYIKKKTKD